MAKKHYIKLTTIFEFNSDSDSRGDFEREIIYLAKHLGCIDNNVLASEFVTFEWTTKEALDTYRDGGENAVLDEFGGL